MKNVDSLKFLYKKLFFEPVQASNMLDVSAYAIAGGAIRDYLSGGQVKDIDVFCRDQDAQDRLLNWLKSKVAQEGEVDGEVVLMNENDQLANIKWKGRWFQVIKGKFFDLGGTDLIDSFDYTICAAMLTEKDFRCHPAFFQDTLAKHLRIIKITFPLSTFERMQKYIQKGYTACNGTLLAVARATASVDFDNPSQDALRFYPDGTPRFVGMD